MRKISVVAACAVAALALTACGAKDGSAPSNGSGDAQLGLASPFTDILKLTSAAKQGTEKAKTSKVKMTMDAGGQKMEANGAGSYNGDDTQFTMTMSGEKPGQTTEMRYVGKTIYIKLDASDQQSMGTTKPWAKISPDGQDPISQTLGTMMSKAAKESDPATTLARLAQAGKISQSDQTKLDGTAVNHYRIDVDPQKAIDQFADGVPAAAKAQLADKLKGKNVSIPTEIWLNSDQLPVKVTMDETAFVTALAGKSSGSAKVEVTYSDWGSPVTVAAPPADQTVDIAELMKGIH